MNLRRLFALLAFFFFLGITRSEIQATTADAWAECMKDKFTLV